jgi:predicted RNase H-like HicB family nuclease
MTYTVVLLHEPDGRYSAVVPALDCASWGHTIPEALRMVAEAIRCHVDSLEAHGDRIPSDTDTFTVEMGEATDAVIYRVAVPGREELSLA